MSAVKTDLLDLSQEELKAWIEAEGEKGFRAKQLYKQLYQGLAPDFESMTDLSKGLREMLNEKAVIGSLKLSYVFEGDEGLTRKALWQFPDGATVESVLMIYPDRSTVCVSSQAGCPMGCVFCATAKMGHLHDLTPGQMNQQILWAAREVPRMQADFDRARVKRHRVTKENYPERLTNVVYMGMGEPFNNYDNWWASVKRLNDAEGFNMGARSFTVSTVGLVPGIDQLAEEKMQVNLAVSLHTADDERRSKLMPVNRRYPIADLMTSVHNYTDKTGRRVSFEYVLLENENDSEDEAHAVGKLLTRPVRALCHVNLIPWNPVPGTGLERSQMTNVNRFKSILEHYKVPCTIRIHRGVDIDAACGQLAGSYQEHKGVSLELPKVETR